MLTDPLGQRGSSGAGLWGDWALLFSWIVEVGAGRWLSDGRGADTLEFGTVGRERERNDWAHVVIVLFLSYVENECSVYA